MLNPFCFEQSNLTPPELTALVQMILDKGIGFIADVPNTVISHQIANEHHVNYVYACKYRLFGLDFAQVFVCWDEPELYTSDKSDCLIQNPTLEIITQHILQGSE